MEFTIKNLERCFESAKEKGSNYIAVKVRLQEEGRSEIIINEKSNLDFKLDYYKNAYNDDLTHKHDNKVRIIGFTHRNTFCEIEKDLR